MRHLRLRLSLGLLIALGANGGAQAEKTWQPYLPERKDITVEHEVISNKEASTPDRNKGARPEFAGAQKRKHEALKRYRPSATITLKQWKQLYFDLYNLERKEIAQGSALSDEPQYPHPRELRQLNRQIKSSGDAYAHVIPLYIHLDSSDPEGYTERHFYVVPQKERTSGGNHVSFYIESVLPIDDAIDIYIDFDDGQGYRRVEIGEMLSIRYTSPGRKKIKGQVDIENEVIALDSPAFLFSVKSLGLVNNIRER